MTRRTVPVVIIVYGVVGNDGELEYVATEDPKQEIYVGATNNEGEFVAFEAEACHLAQWCKHNGFRYYEGQIAMDVDLEEIA